MEDGGGGGGGGSFISQKHSLGCSPTQLDKQRVL